MATPGSALGAPLVAFLRGLIRRDFGEVALNRVQQHGVALGGIATNLGLVSKFQADAVALDPADSAFDRTAVVQLQLDFLPELQWYVGADHRPAARQVDQVDDIFATPDLQMCFAVAEEFPALRTLVD